MSTPKNRADVVALMAETIIAMRDCEPAAVALAVLAQQEAAGLRVVPVKATEAMERRGAKACNVEAGDIEAWGVWPAMLAASPCAPDAKS